MAHVEKIKKLLEMPVKGQKRQKQPRVYRLILMAALPVRELGESDQIARDVGVITIDIGLSMMHKNVMVTPEEGRPPNPILRVAPELIHPPLGGDSTVICIVLNRKTYKRHEKPEKTVFDK